MQTSQQPELAFDPLTDGETAGWSDYIPYSEAYDEQKKAIATFSRLLASRGYYINEGACGTGKTLIALAGALNTINNKRSIEQTVDVSIPDYNRVFAVTPVKQQLQQFIDEMRSINTYRSTQTPPDPPSPTLVIRGRTDLTPLFVCDEETQTQLARGEIVNQDQSLRTDHTQAAGSDSNDNTDDSDDSDDSSDSDGASSPQTETPELCLDDYRNISRDLIRFDSHIPIDWSNVPDDVVPEFAYGGDDLDEEQKRQREELKSRYRYNPYRALAVKHTLINIRERTEDFSRLTIQTGETEFETPYPDRLPQVSDVVDRDEVSHTQLYTRQFDPFYVGTFAYQEGVESVRFAQADAHVFDRPELLAATLPKGMCAHTVMSEIATRADVVIGNYHHLADPQTTPITTKMGLFSEQTILVVDEAHEIEEKVRDMYSREMSIRTLVNALRDLDRLQPAAAKNGEETVANLLRPPDADTQEDYRNYLQGEQEAVQRAIDTVHTQLISARVRASRSPAGLIDAHPAESNARGNSNTTDAVSTGGDLHAELTAVGEFWRTAIDVIQANAERRLHATNDRETLPKSTLQLNRWHPDDTQHPLTNPDADDQTRNLLHDLAQHEYTLAKILAKPGTTPVHVAPERYTDDDIAYEQPETAQPVVSESSVYKTDTGQLALEDDVPIDGEITLLPMNEIVDYAVSILRSGSNVYQELREDSEYFAYFTHHSDLEAAANFLGKFINYESVRFFPTIRLESSSVSSLPTASDLSLPMWMERVTPKLQLCNTIPDKQLRERFSQFGSGILMSATIDPVDIFTQAVGVTDISFDTLPSGEQKPYSRYAIGLDDKTTTVELTYLDPDAGSIDPPRMPNDRVSDPNGLSTIQLIETNCTQVDNGGKRTLTRPVVFEQYQIQYPQQNRQSIIGPLPRFTTNNRGYPNQTYGKMNETRREYAKALTKLTEIQPGNILLSLPSYREAEWARDYLQDKTEKKLFLDTSSSAVATSAQLAEFFAADEAVLFTSTLGTVTEGIDYDGDKLHSVIAVGLPLMPHHPPHRAATRRAYDTYIDTHSGFDSAFAIPAVRKTRQALGRVIRSDTDVGTRILLDERYCGDAPYGNVGNYLSEHERNEFQVINSLSGIENVVSAFWTNVDSD